LVESGGPATQAGIFYQNSISALYLGRLIDYRDRHSSEQVVRVQVEAKADVDDTIVTFLDGRKVYFHIKRGLTGAGNAWSNLWADIKKQINSTEFSETDKITIIFGDYSNLHNNLKEICDRVVTSETYKDFLSRLTKDQKPVLEKVCVSLNTNDIETLKLLKSISVEIRPDETLERDFAPVWMPESNKSALEIYSHLRDITGGEAKLRGDFKSAYILDRLRSDFDTNILLPKPWNADNYRETLINECNICIPAIPNSQIHEDDFVWPKAQKFDRKATSDFEDDNAHWFERKSDLINLSNFPYTDIRQAIVIAGPGFGKSALIQVLCASIARNTLFPVKILLKELIGSEDTILDYCLNSVNRTYSTNIDWKMLFEKGNAVVFLDGLDEINTNSRVRILGKINVMSARFPQLSWMLTVRDISAVNISTKAEKIELCPLDDSDINQYIKTYQPSLSESKVNKLHDKIKAHKDLRALSKIPLFLALYLSLQNNQMTISSRSDLIEMYLKTLLNPEEFRDFEIDDFNVHSLRKIIEKTAFDALEREEIGLKESDIIEAAIPYSSTNSSYIINACLKRGLLSRTSMIHLEFPFPIIQEYLAANYLIKNEMSSLNERFGLIAKRPWAQTIQFALELHPQPDDISSQILKAGDDAFNTNLRLIGRCIANGMKVSQSIKYLATNRLADIWTSVAWRTQHHIGQVLLDTIEMPISDRVLAKLKNPYLLQSEASDILININDPEITRSVLIALLDGDLEVWNCFRNLSPALSGLGDEVIDLIWESIADKLDDKEYCENIALCLGGIDGSFLSKTKYEKIAFDKSLPISIRLAAFYIGPSPLDNRAYPLINKAIKISPWKGRSIAKKCIAKSKNEALINENLLDQKIKIREKIDLIWTIAHLERHRKDRIPFCKNILNLDLPTELINQILLIMARNGDEPSMVQLINQIPTCDDIGHITDIISLLGHFPKKEVGILVVNKINKIAITAKTAPSMLQSLSTGLTFIFEMDMPSSGALESCSPHPAISSFSEIIEKCLSTKRIKKYKKLDMFLCAHRIGIANYSQQVYGLTIDLLSNLSLSEEHNNEDHSISSAILELADAKQFLPLSILEKFSLSKMGNVSIRCISMIGKLNSNEAIEALINLHNKPSSYSRQQDIKAELEVLASRFGIRIIEELGTLSIAT